EVGGVAAAGGEGERVGLVEPRRAEAGEQPRPPRFQLGAEGDGLARAVRLREGYASLDVLVDVGRLVGGLGVLSLVHAALPFSVDFTRAERETGPPVPASRRAGGVQSSSSGVGSCCGGASGA